MLKKFVLFTISLFALGLFGATAPVLAQSAQQPKGNVIEDCVAIVIDARKAEMACTGLIAEPCLGQIEGENKGAAEKCLLAETAAWEAIRKATYKDIRTSVKEANYDAVKSARKAWKKYLERQCALPGALSGEASGLQGAFCVRDLTARRALDLRTLLFTLPLAEPAPAPKSKQ